MGTAKRHAPEIVIKRIYEEVVATDGYRVLVDRLWPRGLKKEAAPINHWAKELAPSVALRKWFNHEAAKFAEFRTKYLMELLGKEQSAQKMLASIENQRITLLYAARDASCNHAQVLQDFLASQVKDLRSP